MKIMYDVLGAYRGIDVYMISRKDFFDSLEEKDRVTKKYMWMILDDNMLIYEGRVIGQVNKDRKSVQEFLPASYEVVYGKYIRERKKKEDEPKVQPQPLPVIERVTVEKLYKQGTDKLKAISHEAEDKYLDCGNAGAEKLAALYQVGLTLVEKYKKKEA